MITPYYRSVDKDFTLLQGGCIELLKSFDFKFDMVFADPPYHYQMVVSAFRVGAWFLSIKENGINRKALRKITNLIRSGCLLAGIN